MKQKQALSHEPTYLPRGTSPLHAPTAQTQTTEDLSEPGRVGGLQVNPRCCRATWGSPVEW